MCTVSYIKTPLCSILTSNRDEHIQRPSADVPQEYHHGNKSLFYPKDPSAGGTWFCLDPVGNVMILLNGALEKHHAQPPYRKSRGLIVLELMENDEVKYAWDESNLDNIEPFTLVYFSEDSFYQFQWNGIQKTTQHLNITEPKIWSSATLYPSNVRDARKDWYRLFLEQFPNPSPQQLMEFHRNAGQHDPENGLLMNRDHKLLTKNITQCIIEKDGVELIHLDLVEQSSHKMKIPCRKP